MKKLRFEECFDKIKIENTEDFTFKYQSKWTFYSFNLNNKKSLWYTIQDKIEQICDEWDPSDEEIDMFLDDNPDIDLEIDFFINEMSDIFFFKVKNKIYCYMSNITQSVLSKKDDIIVRFLFDIDEIINY